MILSQFLGSTPLRSVGADKGFAVGAIVVSIHTRVHAIGDTHARPAPVIKSTIIYHHIHLSFLLSVFGFACHCTQ